MSPYEIHIVMHYYCQANEHEPKDWTGPSVGNELHMQTMVKLVGIGLLTPRIPSDSYTARYETTPMGEAYVKQLMSMPFPKQVWVRGDE